MNLWTKERLDQMIADKVEESLMLDYKRADSLAKNDKRIAEVTKDVSSFANSSGGTLIYGVAEPKETDRRHLPERIDPISRTEISKEWLDQVIQTIQPRVDGVVIHPVTISEQDNTVCYVVEVPKSHTAHMARDHRYYKRQNFNSVPMEDYEVRDVMGRRKVPRVTGAVFMSRQGFPGKPGGQLLARLENIGHVLARHVMVKVDVPLDMNGLVTFEDCALTHDGDMGRFYSVRLVPNLAQPPLFPGSDVILSRRFDAVARVTDNAGQPLPSSQLVRVSIFADEMPPILATLSKEQVLAGWNPIVPAPTSV